MANRAEARRHVRRPINCPISVSWQDRQGATRFLHARGVDISDSGARIECTEPIEPNAQLFVRIDELGMIGTALVRHCARKGVKYFVGLELSEDKTRAEHSVADHFEDYYELLQISASAEMETVHRVYRLLAARYHPDNPESGDSEKFLRLNRAYHVLSNAEERAKYDAQYQMQQAEPIRIFELKEFLGGVEGETNRRLGVLSLLYNRRRMNPEKPGLSLLEFERLMSFPREHLLFTVWFLKEKGYLGAECNGDYTISAEGAEYVESRLPSNRILYKLIGTSADTAKPAPPQEAPAEPAMNVPVQ